MGEQKGPNRQPSAAAKVDISVRRRLPIATPTCQRSICESERLRRRSHVDKVYPGRFSSAPVSKQSKQASLQPSQTVDISAGFRKNSLISGQPNIDGEIERDTRAAPPSTRHQIQNVGATGHPQRESPLVSSSLRHPRHALLQF